MTIADVMRASAPTYGVLFQGNTKAVLDHVTIVAGDNGVMLIDGIAPATIDVTVTDSVIANNQTAGVANQVASSVGQVRLRRTAITGNGTGWAGAGIVSYGDNTIENNGSGNTAPPSATSK